MLLKAVATVAALSLDRLKGSSARQGYPWCPLPYLALSILLLAVLAFRALRVGLSALRSKLRDSARRSQLLRGTRAAATRRALRRALDDISPETVGDVVPAQLASCAICLDRISADELVRTLSCLHAYHSQCLERLWASSARRICPLCRFPFLA